MKRIVLLFTLILMFLPGMGFVSKKMAFAASREAQLPQASASACATSPSDNNCDGADPNPNCVNDATTVQPAVYLYDQVRTGTSDPIAYIELRWSQTCQSNWARATTYTGITNPQTGVSYSYFITEIEVLRDDGVGEQYVPPFNTTSAWTNMVYAPVRKAEACIQYRITDSNGGSGMNPGTWYCTNFL